MKLTQTRLPEVVVIDLTLFPDDRGWFAESYSDRRFHDGLRAFGLTPPRPFVQDNHSLSAKGVLRGLHLQKAPHPQGKLVRVVAGAAFDVAVDVRVGSPTFGQWVGVELSAANHRMLWIPEGFAHGFMALEDDTHFLYKTTDYYARDCERAVRWDDPAIGIEWPDLTPVLAAKDAEAPTLAEARDAGDLF
ncbi:dTDP-4-dehydrorhamnose 3,5-epimerase [Bordetella genomosp. 1]|uniref:dTDP-4-dehydrorhamnose 3,5-epimerase n=1 Tax=Bordetella genomosp. 1 TaxID=1395607 RepID=A0A261RSX3_9BORD|nr:dTDP-4-dehydrorhamnose 3,5-epimerase [Bordetella genomosp. 1]MDQ8030984.1 dTDP-4-dehydrorhamnose 3,5-epimerase [Bordetella sp.]OZI28139.1 dTDP-4-dehydrorhamnose 3,5-epimerase [Bordetella genomosp. 1]